MIYPAYNPCIPWIWDPKKWPKDPKASQQNITIITSSPDGFDSNHSQMACCFTRSAASSSKTCLAIAIPPWKKQGGTGRCPSGYPAMLGLFHGKSQKWMMTGPLWLRKPPCKETYRFKQKKTGFCKYVRQKCGFEHQTLEIKQQNRRLNQQAKCIWSYPTKSHNVVARSHKEINEFNISIQPATNANERAEVWMEPSQKVIRTKHSLLLSLSLSLRVSPYICIFIGTRAHN